MILELSPKVAAVDPGDTLRFSVSIKNGDGAVKPLGPSSGVIWTSSASEIAVVDEDGLVRSMAPGEVQITAAYPSVIDASASLTVKPSPPSNGMIPAFPGAEGWGATALNECRDKPLQVLAVTNTNTDGPGSFDQALKDVRSDHFTFILFHTGGNIRTPNERARLNASCVYIAGQTAPGGGVVITENGLWLRGYGENISDIVIRYMRFRGAYSNINISKGQRIVLDHVSSSWSSDHLLSVLRYPGDWSQPIADVSIQNLMLSETTSPHPTAFNTGAQDPNKQDATIGVTNLSLHRNLFASNSHRNPSMSVDNSFIANNVLYNWNQGTIQLNRRGVVDVVNNYGKEGPMTLNGSSPNFRYMVNPHCDDTNIDMSLYAAGNVGPMSMDPDGDNWSGATRQVACYYTSGDEWGEEAPARWRRSDPQDWGSIPFPVTVQTAADAYESVLNLAGANARLACDGTWVSARDSVDSRIVEEVSRGKGVSAPLKSPGTVPNYGFGGPCEDSDDDGLPDTWEERFFGCSTCANPAALGRGGYLVMEHYLNGTSPN